MGMLRRILPHLRAPGGRQTRLSARRWHGQSLLIVALAFMGLLGFVALAIDAGVLFLNRVWLGEAADAASLAGGFELPNENAACARAVEYLESNGYAASAGFSFQIIFPEANEIDKFPALPSDKRRVLNSPTRADCARLTIPGDHSYIWVTGQQEVRTMLLFIVGIDQVSTAVPAVAKQPDRFGMVFVLDHGSTMRADTCLYDHDKYVFTETGRNLNGSLYACTPQSPECNIVPISNPGFETALTNWVSVGASSSMDVGPALAKEGRFVLALRQRHNVKPVVSQIVRTAEDYLYLAFWVRAPNQGDVPGIDRHDLQDPNEAFGVWLRWDANDDGVINAADGAGDRGDAPRIVQFCATNVEDYCRSCPTRKKDGPLWDLSCKANFDFTNLTDEWIYVVTELDPKIWNSSALDTFEIAFHNYGKESYPTPMRDNDVVLVDDVQLLSCPWNAGPFARYHVGGAKDGLPECGSGSVWPNCDTTYNSDGNRYPTPPDGSAYEPPDVLFPARNLMQQPLYSVMLSIGKNPGLGGKPSMLDLLGPGHQVGFATFRLYSFLHGAPGGDAPEYLAMTSDYNEFRRQFFGTVQAAHRSGDGYNNLAAGIAAGRRLLADIDDEKAPVMILITTGKFNASCGEHNDTYCYDARSCPPSTSHPLYQSCRDSAWAWIKRQVGYARSEGILIFPIGLGEKSLFNMDLHHDEDRFIDNVDILEYIADATGGHAYYLTDVDQLPETMVQVLEDLKPVVFLAR